MTSVSIYISQWVRLDQTNCLYNLTLNLDAFILGAATRSVFYYVAIISYSTVVLYIGIMKVLEILARNYHPKTSLIFTF